jgi:membrane associated rhomboid family serine protease
MLILSDESRHDARVPWVTWSLIAVNLLVFLGQLQIGDPLTYGFSLIPAELTQGKDLTRPESITVKRQVPVTRDPRVRGRIATVARDEQVEVPQYPGPVPIYLTLLTSMFMHAGVIHLLGNLYFLYLFGDNVEHALGHLLFLVFYLLCGLTAGMAQYVSDPSSVLPILGASGAISGVLGAYLSIYPLNTIKVWMGWYWGVVEVPAFIVLGLWVLQQYLSAFAANAAGKLDGGVAYWAHLGGFAAGLILIWTLIFIAQMQEAGKASD